MSDLEKELETALMQRYDQWRTIGYTATYFKRMLTPGDPISKGPVATVKHLMAREGRSLGFERLLNANKLEWTVEALLQDPKWKPLFKANEIAIAKARLEKYK